MSGNDLASVVVGAIAGIAGIAATFAMGWIGWTWYWYGASPRERAERTLAKWARRAGKRFR